MYKVKKNFNLGQPEVINVGNGIPVVFDAEGIAHTDSEEAVKVFSLIGEANGSFVCMEPVEPVEDEEAPAIDEEEQEAEAFGVEEEAPEEDVLDEEEQEEVAEDVAEEVVEPKPVAKKPTRQRRAPAKLK